MRSTRDSTEAGGGALLELRDLSVAFETPRGLVEAVRGVTLELRRGECLAVVGESGAGKSQLFLGAFGLLAGGGRTSGAALFDGRDLLAQSAAARRELLGTRVALVFQDPMNALTPHLTVGQQLAEGVLDRGLMDAAAARARSLEVLRAVRLPDPESRLRQYPHELSGGQRQRVAIAMSLMTAPELLVADEPTTALDVTVQAQVVEVLAEARDRGLALVLITHDLGVVAGIADRVAVMYAGRLVEVAPVRELYAGPRHPYTAALLESVPRLRGPAAGRLAGVDGQPPSPGQQAPGCAFAPRCSRAGARCLEERPALEAHAGRAVACHAPLPAGAGP